MTLKNLSHIKMSADGGCRVPLAAALTEEI